MPAVLSVLTAASTQTGGLSVFGFRIALGWKARVRYPVTMGPGSIGPGSRDYQVLGSGAQGTELALVSFQSWGIHRPNLSCSARDAEARPGRGCSDFSLQQWRSVGLVE